MHLIQYLFYYYGNGFYSNRNKLIGNAMQKLKNNIILVVLSLLIARFKILY